MSYYPEPSIHIRNKFKVVLDLPNYGTIKELDHSTGVDIAHLAVKKVSLLLKQRFTN